MNQLMRQATLGALTSSLLHDLASTMQTLDAALGEIKAYTEEMPEVDRRGGRGHTRRAQEAVQLFVQMRKFIRDGEVSTKPVPDPAADRSRGAAGRWLRPRARDSSASRRLPEALVAVAESLFLQVLANLLRNAANASPPRRRDRSAWSRATDTEVTFVVTDDGAGRRARDRRLRCSSRSRPTRSEGTGLGLAIAAYVMQMLGGRIQYRKDPTRGACFSVTLPRASEAEPE